MNSQLIEPLEPESRVRVKGRHANIVAVKSTDPLVYLVEFDNDVVYKPTKKNPDAHYKVKRELAHADITEVMEWCLPESAFVEVDPLLFMEMGVTGGFDELPTGSSVYSTKFKREQVLAEGTKLSRPPLLWNDRYWIFTNGGCQDSGDGKGFHYTPLEAYPLIPLADYKGEIRAPSKVFEGYGGYLVTFENAKFVTEDKPLHIRPTEIMYVSDWEEDEDEDESVTTKPKSRKVTKRAARAETQVQTEPEQMSFI